MLSWQARAFIFVLRHRHWLQFRLFKRRTIDWQTSIPELRKEVERGAQAFGGADKDIAVSIIDEPNFKAELLQPIRGDAKHIILYFHGGGYVAGSARSHRAIVSKFIRSSGVGALVIDYRLAPEHPYPAALNDSTAAYWWLLRNGYEPQHIVFAGDSAGGGLCLATMLAIKEHGMTSLPAGAVVLSPWADLLCTGESYSKNAVSDPATWPGSWHVFSKYYAGDEDLENPLISPMYGDFSGFPPLLIYVGSNEVLYDDASELWVRATMDGVPVIETVGFGLFHCYPVCSPLFPEARQAMADIGRFIRECLEISSEA